MMEDWPDQDPEYDQWLEAMDDGFYQNLLMTSDLDEFRFINAMDTDTPDPSIHMWPDDSWFEGFITI